jgi:hypothetical protein
MAPYQQRVSECLQHAQGLSDFQKQAVWRELALCWLRLADISNKFRSDVIDSNAAWRAIESTSGRPDGPK